jgi:transposase-like protein
MYSYEDRVRAVELYLKLGKRVKATVRQLGSGPTASLPGATARGHVDSRSAPSYGQSRASSTEALGGGL